MLNRMLRPQLFGPTLRASQKFKAESSKRTETPYTEDAECTEGTEKERAEWKMD